LSLLLDPTPTVFPCVSSLFLNASNVPFSSISDPPALPMLPRLAFFLSQRNSPQCGGRTTLSCLASIRSHLFLLHSARISPEFEVHRLFLSILALTPLDRLGPLHSGLRIRARTKPPILAWANPLSPIRKSSYIFFQFAEWNLITLLTN